MSEGGGLSTVLLLPFLLLFLYLISFAVTISFGMPFYLLLNYFNFIRWWSTVIAGCIAGVIPAWFFASGRGPGPSVSDFDYICSLGMLASFTFWAVWCYQNPVSSDSEIDL